MTTPTVIANVGCESCLNSVDTSDPIVPSGAPYVSGAIQIFNPPGGPSTYYQFLDNNTVWLTPVYPEETHVVNSVRIMSPDPENISVGLYERTAVVGSDMVWGLLVKATFGVTPSPNPVNIWHTMNFAQGVTLTSGNTYGLVYSYESASAPAAGFGRISALNPSSGGAFLPTTWPNIVTNGVLPLSWTMPASTVTPGTPGASYFALRSIMGQDTSYGFSFG